MVIKIRELIREIVINMRYLYLTKIYSMNIHKSAKISFGAKLDKTYPVGIHIGSETYVAGGGVMFTHDYSRSLRVNTIIGNKCFIGANVIIMAGIIIGDEVIVGAGAVVTKSIPSNCIVAGNPARIIRENIKTTKYGKLINEK